MKTIKTCTHSVPLAMALFFSAMIPLNLANAGAEPLTYDGAVDYVRGVSGLPSGRVVEDKPTDPPQGAEKLTILHSEDSCGPSGCSQVVFLKEGAGKTVRYRPIGKFIGKFRIMNVQSAGLPDIQVATNNSGGGDYLYYTLNYTGERYQRGGK